MVAGDCVGGPPDPEPRQVPAEEPVQEGERIGARDLDGMLRDIEEGDAPAQVPVGIRGIFPMVRGKKRPLYTPSTVSGVMYDESQGERAKRLALTRKVSSAEA